jgi:trans-aconitate 2-methyltransferase
MSDWNAHQYLKFEDERSRPARDLLAQVPLQQLRAIADLGCGPGNSTELLLERYPRANVTGVDSSQAMLRQARERLPQCSFIESDISAWMPEEPVDLLFANAVFQWVPDHRQAMLRLAALLPEGGVLAAQMPDNTREPSHVAMETVFGVSGAARVDLPAAESYYDLLKPQCQRVEIWHTIYHHVMDGPEAIVEWFKGSALRPFLAGLDGAEADRLLQEYTAEIARCYPARSDGKVLLRFPRLFVIAVR